MAEKPIGKILHYYDKIGVAIVELSGTLKQGERIKIKRGGEEFEQAVESMQIEHKDLKEAKKGQSVGMKTAQPVKQGAEIFRVKG